MQCTKPVRIKPKLNKAGRYSMRYSPSQIRDGLLVPCGKCLACRVSRRREWATRMLHELSSYRESAFLTLTYDDDHLPPNGSLDKAALQKFFKRLRKSLGDRKIRYFACGEYGELYGRPHYHAIVYGIGLCPADKKLVMDAWPFCDWTNYKIFRGAFGLVEPDSVRYVAQYIDKKFTGEVADREYKDKGREPVFKLSSLGLGKQWCDTNAARIRARPEISVNGIVQALPRYYVNRLGLPRELLETKSIERDHAVVEYHTGISDLTRDDAYHALLPDAVRRMEEGIQASKRQHSENLAGKSRLKKRDYDKKSD